MCHSLQFTISAEKCVTASSSLLVQKMCHSLQFTVSAEKVTDRPSATQPTNLAWDVSHPDYIVAFTASSSRTCFGVSERVSW